MGTDARATESSFEDLMTAAGFGVQTTVAPVVLEQEPVVAPVEMVGIPEILARMESLDTLLHRISWDILPAEELILKTVSMAVTTSTKAISMPSADATTRLLHDQIIKKVISIQNRLAEKLKKSSELQRMDEVRTLIEIEKTLSQEVSKDLGKAKGDKSILDQVAKVLALEHKLQTSAESELEELKKLQARRLLEE